MTTSLAVINDYVVVNTRNEASIYLTEKPARKLEECPIWINRWWSDQFLRNADDGDNILVSNLAPNAGTYKVWRINGVDGTPKLYIDWTSSPAVGRKLLKVVSTVMLSLPRHDGDAKVLLAGR